LMKSRGFESYNFWPDSAPKPITPEVMAVRLPDIVSIVAFINTHIFKEAVLLQCTEGLVAELQTFFCVTLVTRSSPHNAFTRLDLPHASGQYKLLVGTEHLAFRGIDYRAPDHRICLVLTLPFATEREYRQALMRVGRHGDECIRYRKEGVAEFDPDETLKAQARHHFASKLTKAKRMTRSSSGLDI